MPRVPVNPVWNYFTIHDDGSFKCHIGDCEANFAPPVNTTNAKRHLKRFHKDQLGTVQKLEEERKVLKNAFVGKPMSEVIALIVAATDGLEEGTEGPGEMESAVSQALPCIIDTPTGSSTCDAAAAEPTHTDKKNNCIKPGRKRIACKSLSQNQPADIANDAALPPKRKAAIEAMERVRTANKWLASMKKSKVVKAKRSKRSAIAHQKAQDTEDDSYPVEEILDERYQHGTRQLLIKWLGWADSFNSWEPITNVDNCDALLHAFENGMDEGFEEFDGE